MHPNTEELRKKYMDNPPEGMTSEDIRLMSEDDLLDMDDFLNEDEKMTYRMTRLVLKIFISSKITLVLLSCPNQKPF